MNIIICGLVATGKSSLARKIAKDFKMDYISSSTILKGDMGFNYVKEKAFWDKKGLSLFKDREKKDFDKKVDKLQLGLAKEGGKVFDTWALGWLYKGKAIKVLLFASDSVRISRLMGRDKITKAEALKAMKERDTKNEKLFRRLYGIEVTKDRSPFDLIVNTDYLTEEEVHKMLKTYLSKALKTL
ncbi:MAG: cytidylate kinase family protein [Candidatus ainarchaeum sp.]|nr:cytidylate kinase family protein [Candidatus ainarchaeum sp.]